MKDSKKQLNLSETDPLVKWGGWLNEFLWICAGANRKVLRQCPTDYAKYAGIGGTILFTALMAMLSGGYALFFVFNNINTAIAFGIFWGLLIFNLDRFIVNTMYSDGKVTISKREFVSGLPRIIMAIFLGVVISTPLEMKIFEDRIDSQLVKDNIERTNASRSKVDEGNKPLVERRNQLEKQQAEIQSRLSKAEEELKQEGEGTALSGKAGHGQIYKDKEANKNAIEKELNAWNASHLEELNDLKSQIKINRDKGNADIAEGNNENGFCVRYEAFSNLKSENVSLNIVSIVIMLLFIIIETAPTFFKMMIASGPYDDWLRAEMHRVKILSDKKISDINDEVNTAVKISVEKNKGKLEAELAANKLVMEKLASAQAELLEKAIEDWRKKEFERIKDNPSEYIKVNGSDIESEH
ncbi:MAG: DUF4407 domain-containing protein [Bacteroidaceae bacterium]|nr:DUF4407 domain-containing protein [Bacteroidaceae bacterium]